MSAITDEAPGVEAPVNDTPATEQLEDGTLLDDGSVYVRTSTDGTFVTAQSLAESARNTDKSKVDIPKFEAAFSVFKVKLLALGNAWRVVDNLTAALADLMMDTRLAVILSNGDPDYWGTTAAYRSLFSTRITMWMAQQGFAEAETEKLLTNIRTNYFRVHQNVIETIAFEEVRRGNVAKMAKVKDAKIIEDEENGKAIEITYERTNKKTGENVVEVYKPGEEMPNPLANAVKNAAARRDELGGRKVSSTLPPRVTGKDKAPSSGTRGNEAGTNVRNYAQEARDAFTALRNTIGHVSPIELAAMFHESATAFSDYLIGPPNVKADHGEGGIPGGPKATGEALFGVGSLFIKTGAYLASAPGITKADVSKFRYVPEGEKSEVDESDENENETEEVTPEAVNN